MLHLKMYIHKVFGKNKTKQNKITRKIMPFDRFFCFFYDFLIQTWGNFYFPKMAVENSPTSHALSLMDAAFPLSRNAVLFSCSLI